MGKKDKEHRKKVQARNARIKTEQKKQAKMFEQLMMKQLDAFKSEGDATTNNVTIEPEQQVIDVDYNGFVQSSDDFKL